MFNPKLAQLWWAPILVISLGIGSLSFFFESPYISLAAYLLIVLGVFWLLLWADSIDGKVHGSHGRVDKPVAESSLALELAAARSELEARIREVAEFKAEMDAKRGQVDALKAEINRTDTAELNEAISQLYVDLEFERGRAVGKFAEVLAGLSQSVEGIFTAAALVKGSPIPGERFVDQAAGSCKVFKTELTSDATLKGTIKEVRSPWVGFMANGKMKIITASNVSVYA